MSSASAHIGSVSTGPSSASLSANTRSVYQVFAEIAQQYPDKTALLCNEHSLSYRDLFNRAESLAARLQQQGVKHGDIVGLVTQRSIEAIIAKLAVIRCGAAYLPFDASYPQKMLRYIYEDASPAAMLLQPGLLDNSCMEVFWQGDALLIDDSPAPAPAEPVEVNADDPIYVMYTSGSTGKPKGVVVPHRGVLRLVLDNNYVSLSADEVILQLCPLAFDVCTFEIWGALLFGGSLAIVPSAHPTLDEIAAQIARHNVSTMWLTAGLFHLMVEHRIDGLKPVRQLLAGGDILSPPHVEKVLRELPDCRMINGYGPTENTTFTTAYIFPRDFSAASSAPIGTAINGTTIHILDEVQQPVAKGEKGELYAGGDGVALGYLNRPELSAERFIADPFSEKPNARLYRTGDLVRQREDGNLEFFGRADRQIKLNGKRVELDEIEYNLRRHDDVADAAALVQETEQGIRHLVAYIVPRNGVALGAELENRVRDFLRIELPDYMVPPSITAMEKFPLSANDKVDRAALAAQPPAPRAAATTAAPLNASTLDAQLHTLFCRALKRDSAGHHENFFDLGGNSLQMIELQALIRSELGRELNLTDLFRFPSISALSRYLNPPAATPSATEKTATNSNRRASGRKAALQRARTQKNR